MIFSIYSRFYLDQGEGRERKRKKKKEEEKFKKSKFGNTCLYLG